MDVTSDADGYAQEYDRIESSMAANRQLYDSGLALHHYYGSADA